MRMVAFWLLLATSFFSLFGCKNGLQSKSINVWSQKEHFEFMPSGWTPDEVIVDCRAGSCPDSVGLLIYIFPQVEGKIPVRRCTAFLNAPNQITSNGHCDQVGKAQGYFITAQSSLGGKQVRKITRRIFKRHTPGADGNDDSARPDIGIYELDSAIDSIAPSKYAAVNDPSFSELVGFGVNRGDKAGEYFIDKIKCSLRRHESTFPFHLSENPDVITAFGCTTEFGNSGGPLFAPGSPNVQGIFQGRGRIDKLAEKVRQQRHRDLYVYERLPYVLISNLRCVGGGDLRCLDTTQERKNDRFQTYQRKIFSDLENRMPPSGATAGVRYRSIPYQFLNNSASAEMHFEVLYQPLCRTGDQVPPVLQMPAEYLKLEFNEFAEIKSQVLDIKLSNLEVSQLQGNRANVKATWAPAFGPLTNESQHPRRIWGKTFSIDLPRCPR